VHGEKTVREVNHGRDQDMVKNTQPTPDAREFVARAVDNYSERLHRFLSLRVRRARDLDDLVQEVYLRLLRVKNVDSIRNPLAYIYGVASHVATEFNMREDKGRVVFDSPITDGALDVRSRMLAGRRVEGGGFFERHINEALGRLSSRHLAVLLLERREGLTHAQIAERLGLSVHTVKKYSVQALACVRASMER
jgi:RNA polymerase sigma-70 factor (ECF subfamily)